MLEADHILTFVGKDKPGPWLLIAPNARRLAAAVARRDPGAVLLPLAPPQAMSELPRLGRQPGALVADVFGALPETEALALLAALRDLYCDQLLVWSADPRRHEILLQLGLTPAQGPPPAGGRIYEFCLRDYKPTPDWLSARHWAHPELWGKFRW